jgi:RIO kinase 2
LAHFAARLTQELEEEDYRVLHAMAKDLARREAFTVEDLTASTGLERKQVEYILEKLNSHELVFTHNQRRILVSRGLDALALHILKLRNSISGLGRALGLGKEADVYEGIRGDDLRVILKFYRIGRISFRDVRRKRAYTSPLRHHHWLLVNIHAARKEFRALRILRRLGLTVPRPIARAYHVVVQELVDGVLLADRPAISQPRAVLLQILEEMGRAFQEAGLINGDLSEYNIIYDGEKAWLIDWPQTLPATHPNAQRLLRRDCANIVNFFRRKYGLDMGVDHALEIVCTPRAIRTR